ncbi:MAG: aminopeptidase P family protein [Nocardioidaceae bacterium]|nr:aminopeptidase P family protein [Nocardioidaceae bacterium]
MGVLTAPATRVERLAVRLEETGAEAALVSPGADLRYLLGESHASFERLTVLVVVPGRPDTLVVPAVEAASWEGLEGRVQTVVWRDGQDPYDVVRVLLGERRRVAVSDAMPAAHLLRFQQRGLDLRLDQAVRRLRSVKEPAEIEQLRLAAVAIDEVHAAIPELIRPGRREVNVARDIGRVMAERGFTSADFVAVASGPNGGSAHHASSDRVLEKHDVVFVDISGPWQGGYHADSTRTYALGRPAPEAVERYAAVREAFERAAATVAPGARAGTVDLAARAALEEAGLREFFVHRTGHGIGLEVHESPSIVDGNDEPLEVGMAFSVEPGVYLPGEFGARLEDIVVVTETGREHLNNRPRELLVL